MGVMFYGATSFNNGGQPLTFDTSQVTDMRHMFMGATAFNQPLDWDTAQVTNMEFMFNGATAFNQPLNWDTAQVTTMEEMFKGATAMTYPVPGEAVPCTDKSQELCVVCMISCVDTVLVPCGHACMCRRCAKRVKGTSGTCPICRVPIECILFNKIYHTGIKQDT
jgi:surface protein